MEQTHGVWSRFFFYMKQVYTPPSHSYFLSSAWTREGNSSLGANLTTCSVFWLTAAFPREKRWPPDLVNRWIIAWAGRPRGSWRGCTLRKCYHFSPTSSGEAKNGKYVWRTLPQPKRTLAVLHSLPSGRMGKSLRIFFNAWLFRKPVPVSWHWQVNPCAISTFSWLGICACGFCVTP